MEDFQISTEFTNQSKFSFESKFNNLYSCSRSHHPLISLLAQEIYAVEENFSTIYKYLTAREAKNKSYPTPSVSKGNLIPVLGIVTMFTNSSSLFHHIFQHQMPSSG